MEAGFWRWKMEVFLSHLRLLHASDYNHLEKVIKVQFHLTDTES